MVPPDKLHFSSGVGRVVECARMKGTNTQKTAVVLAFVAAALSFVAVAVSFARGNGIPVTPLGGGFVMLALGFSGYSRLKDAR